MAAQDKTNRALLEVVSYELIMILDCLKYNSSLHSVLNSSIESDR